MNFKDKVFYFLKESKKNKDKEDKKTKKDKDYEEKMKVVAGCEADGSSVISEKPKKKTCKKEKTLKESMICFSNDESF